VEEQVNPRIKIDDLINVETFIFHHSQTKIKIFEKKELEEFPFLISDEYIVGGILYLVIYSSKCKL